LKKRMRFFFVLFVAFVVKIGLRLAALGRGAKVTGHWHDDWRLKER
jgi:hypothetical protein